MNGIIKFLLSQDVRAVILRKFFVFKIVPMINVDGVYRGHFRYDTNGLNMNRHYASPKLKVQPEIFAIRKLLLYFNSEKRVKYYLDLHGHISTRGLFFYGNNYQYIKHVENLIFPKIMEINSPHFLMEHCIFSLKSMSTKERNDALSKEGTGRVYFARECDLIHSYTVEASNYKGRRTNDIVELPSEPSIPPKLKIQFDKLGIHKFEVLDLDEGFPDEECYTVKMYEKMGIDLLISLLDYEELNPFSRLPASKFENVENIRRHLATKLLENEQYKSNLNYKLSRDISAQKRYPSLLDKINRSRRSSGKFLPTLPKRSNTVQRTEYPAVSLPSKVKQLNIRPLKKQLTEKVVPEKIAKQNATKTLRTTKIKPLKGN